MRLLTLSSFSLLAGCSSVSRLFDVKPAGGAIESVTGGVTTTASNLSMLPGIGGLSILWGIVLLVVTSGRKGWYPILGGILLIVLNVIIQQYFHLIAIPIVVASGIVSAVWAYRSLVQAKEVRNGKGFLPWLRPSLETRISG